MKMVWCFILTIAGLSIQLSSAFAEGYTNSDTNNTGGGVDRFVRTPSQGYLGVLADITLGFYVPTNKWKDNAGFYLGSTQGGIEVDAGINWDYSTYTNPDGSPVTDGYEAFIEYNNVPTAPRYWDTTAKVWKIWRNKSNTYELNYNIDPNTGNVSLSVSG